MKKLAGIIIIILAVLFVGKNASALSGCAVSTGMLGEIHLQCSDMSSGPGTYTLSVNGTVVKTVMSASINETLFPLPLVESHGADIVITGEPTNQAYIYSNAGINELKVNGTSLLCWTATAVGPMGSFNISDLGTCYSAPVPFQGSLGGTISLASNHIKTAVGFTPGSMVAWAGDNLIKLFIGSGLAVLFALRWWIVALVIIGAVVYFAYRAFQFFKR